MKKERLNSEKIINHSYFRVKIGTINKNRPITIYFSGSTFISPNEIKESYDHDILCVKKSFNNLIKSNIKNSNLFENNIIIDFDVRNSGIQKDKKSFLSFQCFLKQKNKTLLSINDIKKTSGEMFYSILNDFKENLNNNEFIVSKRKK